MDFISKYVMEEELNIYNVVKYFVENSGMLFFYTKDDVSVAYNRMFSILNSKIKYFGANLTDEINKLKVYYEFFLNNFDEYSQRKQNKELFSEIMKIDSNIMYCGSNYSLGLYFSDAKKKLKKLNSSSFFFQKMYAVRKELHSLSSILSKIKEYKNFYNLDIEKSEIDDILSFLRLDSLASVDEIITAYSELFKKEYAKLVDTKNVDSSFLNKISNQIAYVRDVLSSVYKLDSKLEKMTLSDRYFQPLSTTPEYYEALRYFGLNPNCTKEEMVDVVETAIDNAMTTELMEKVTVSNSFTSVLGYNDSKSDTLERANYFKKVLYDYFNVKEKVVMRPVTIKKSAYTHKKESRIDFSNLFDGLDYASARKLYLSMRSTLLHSNSKDRDSKIVELDNCWNLIKDTFGEKRDVTFAKHKR